MSSVLHYSFQTVDKLKCLSTFFIFEKNYQKWYNNNIKRGSTYV